MNSPIKKWFAQKRFFLCFLLILHVLCTTSLYCYQHHGYLYISPKPEAVHVSPQSVILFRLQNSSPLDIINLASCVVVSGNLSGLHGCSINIASDNFTVVCKPDLPFAPGEKVTVQIKPRLASWIDIAPGYFEYDFYISVSSQTILKQNATAQAVEDQSTTLCKNNLPSTDFARILPNGVSVPSNFPESEITVLRKPHSGRLFLSTIAKDNFVMILDNNGFPCWYMNTPFPRYDFKVQCNGLVTMFVQKQEGRPFGSGFIGLDDTFTLVDSFYADLDYDTDFHELKLLENGHYLLIGIREETVDLSGHLAEGHANTTVQVSVIQEFTENGELIFLWRAWDFFNIADMQIEDASLPTIRFPHMNAIDIDEDGQILLSSRHLSEITKISRQTGDIIWRLGGAHNQFTFINDPLEGFSGQHDIRALGNGRYLLFDNGNLHQPPLSRVVEYELDTQLKTATLVWEFRDSPDKFTSWMGNAQRLANGFTLINWARRHLPKPAEVTPNGDKVFEMLFTDPVTCYRISRSNWQGIAKKPYLIAEPRDDRITLLFNKFGDTDINFYKIYADCTPGPMTLLDTCNVTKKDFFDFTNRQEYYFRVTAVNQDGQESQFSNEERVFVNFTAPGENMVQNAGFSDHMEHWEFAVRGDALSFGDITEEGQFHFDIQNGGGDFDFVQLYQRHLKLAQGKSYLFEFDGRATADRLIEAYVMKEGDADRNYGKIGPTLLSQRTKHFVYPFKMNATTDYKAMVVFNAGSSDANVYIDNVSLKEKIESETLRSSEQLLKENRLHHNYPNPFNQETKITYHLAGRSHVRLNIFNINGRFIRTLVEKTQEGGYYSVTWNSRNQAGALESSGIYLCRLEITGSNGKVTETKKLTLVR